jgi:hypothetical protein
MGTTAGRQSVALRLSLQAVDLCMKILHSNQAVRRSNGRHDALANLLVDGAR